MLNHVNMTAIDCQPDCLLGLMCTTVKAYDASLSVSCRSATPVCTATLAVFIEKKVPTGEEAAGLILLTLGVMLTVWEGTVSGSVTGLLLCCAGTVCNAAMMSTAGKVMSEKVDVLRLTFYTTPVSCTALLPLFLAREVRLPLLLSLLYFTQMQPLDNFRQ